MLTRTLDEVEAAIIPTNYAFLRNLSPTKDALLVEDKTSLYANIIAVRTKDLSKPELLALKKHITSEKMRAYIQSTYQGDLLLAE